jgi:hypothetical protein
VITSRLPHLHGRRGRGRARLSGGRRHGSIDRRIDMEVWRGRMRGGDRELDRGARPLLIRGRTGVDAKAEQSRGHPVEVELGRGSNYGETQWRRIKR